MFILSQTVVTVVIDGINTAQLVRETIKSHDIKLKFYYKQQHINKPIASSNSLTNAVQLVKGTHIPITCDFNLPP